MGVLNLFSAPYHFEFYVAVIILNEVFEQFLNLRQFLVIKHEFCATEKAGTDNVNNKDPIHEKVMEHVNFYKGAKDYHKTLEYARDKMIFQVVSSLIHTAITIVLVFSRFGPKLWNKARLLYTQDSEYVHSLIFCGLKTLLDTMVEIPFSLYSDFVLEEKHGFNKKTYGLFFKDLALSLALQVAIGAPALCAVIFLYHWGGEHFYFYIFIFIVILNFIILVIYPDLIAPLFNKFEPLKDDDLKTEIETLVRKYDFPLREIKQMDGSKRSSHSNMYFYGFWRFKKIVIYDTLLNQPKEQIIAIASHELGHWIRSHFLKNMCFSFSNIFVIFYLFKSFKDDCSMYESFGYDLSAIKSFIIGITLFGCIYTPLGILIHIIGTTLTRKGEYEADEFAVKAGYCNELATALVDIHKDNKAIIHHDPIYSWYHFTHPVLYERLYAIYKAYEKLKI